MIFSRTIPPLLTMWLSITAQRAVQAVLCVAASADGGAVRVDEIAAVLRSPRNYLSKVLHQLVRAGVLESERGPTGGFRLAIPPERLSLARIIAPFETVGQRQCLIGLPRCSDAHPCHVHHRWVKLATPVDEFFRQTTVAMLLGESPRTSDAAREAIRSMRLTNRRKAWTRRTTNPSE